MKHHIKLRVQPFDMRSGQKTYELRLCDDNWQQLSVNDERL